MRRLTGAALVACACVATACGRQEDTAPPVASVAATLSAPRAEAGAPITNTYTFGVPAGASALPADRWVFVHALDESNELLWTDDHPPVTPTEAWRPGTAVAAGAALGFVAAASAITWAGQPPAAGYCWFYTDPSYRSGFWDVCPP